MRRFMMHLLVAVIAFVVGVAAANLLGLLSGRGDAPRRFGARIERRVTREAPSVRPYDCPYSRPLGELPVAPVAPAAPEALPELPPPPPAAVEAHPRVSKRIIIREADGTTRVIEAPPAAQVR